MLPKETKYTKDVVTKILKKYRKAWQYINKKSPIKPIKNDLNLTRLERRVGKEKLECLDKYLKWEGNGSSASIVK